MGPFLGQIFVGCLLIEQLSDADMQKMNCQVVASFQLGAAKAIAGFSTKNRTYWRETIPACPKGTLSKIRYNLKNQYKK